MSVRIEDVARAAGVSMKTVSRVLNHEPNVREETQRRVENAVRQLNYRPHPSARSLAGNRSHLIALLYDNPSGNYMMEVISGVLDACEANHYSLMLRPLPYGQPNMIEMVDELIARYRPDGLLLTPPVADDTALLRRLAELNLRFSSVSAQSGNCQFGVTLDEQQAVIDMMAHIVSLGHRRIAHVAGHLEHGARGWRLAGYHEGLRRAGISFDAELVVDGEFSFESGVTAALRLLGLKKRPTAIFAANDDTAAGVIHAALERGLQLPDDLSVFGFDDSPVSRQIWPSLTTVRQPLREMGKIAAMQLHRAIRDPASAQLVHMGYQLQLRRSTGPAPLVSRAAK